MNPCPHCQTPVPPARRALLLLRNHYRCPKCQGRSKVVDPTRGFGWVVVTVFIIALSWVNRNAGETARYAFYITFAVLALYLETRRKLVPASPGALHGSEPPTAQ